MMKGAMQERSGEDTSNAPMRSIKREKSKVGGMD